MRSTGWIVTSCCGLLLSGCLTAGMTDPLWRDVAREPPKAKPATVRYLAQHDAHVLAWMLEMARACDDHGC